MAIASIEFGNHPSTPSAPPSGAKVFLAADGTFSSVDSTGVVKPLSSGGVTVFPNLASFPVVGDAAFIYIASDTAEAWRWSTDTSEYTLLVSTLDAGTY